MLNRALTATVATVILALVAAGCGGQETGEEKRGVHTNPGPVKADGTNSCVGNCGGQALAGCWCDSLCEVFQDCCADYDAECATPQTCGPWPGGQCPAGDVCDIQSCGIGGGGTCVAQPDPSDCVQLMYLPAEPVCGCDGKTYGSNCDRLAAGAALKHKGSCNPTPPPPPQTCGPWLNGQCPSGQVCDIQSCGIGAGGTCVAQPDPSDCVQLMYLPAEPVCGCDGKTYGSDCDRLAAGAALDHKGSCNPTPPPPPPPQTCGPWLNGQCPSGQVCDIQACGIGAGGVCIVQPDASQCVDLMWQQPQPVCGCDGVTYNNDCLRQAAGAALDYQGAC